MPTDLPRRQTTSQRRPVLASRENANRNFAGSELGSSIVTFAPVVDRSFTTHWRAAKPPSSVIHPGWLNDLRVSRFLLLDSFESKAMSEVPPTKALRHAALNSVASGPSPGVDGDRERPKKRVFERLAHPAKRHYTFARRRLHEP
jgi:hypothetical protein